MTVSTTTSRAQYNGDGVSVTFAVNFYFLANADLKVYVGGVLKTLTTDYSVSGAGVPAGGSITFVTAPITGTGNVVIVRDPDQLQSTSFPSNDPFPSASNERAVDKLTMLLQRTRDLLTRTFTLSDSDTSGASVTIPTPVAGAVLGWDATAKFLQNYLGLSSAPVSPVMGPVIASSTLALARSNMGINADIQDGSENYLGTFTGTNTLTATASPTLTAQMTTGSRWYGLAAGANTTAMTINVDGQGVVSIVRPDGTATQANDIPAAGYVCLLEKRAGDVVLLNPANLIAQQVDGVVGSTRNGKMSVTAASATATFTADEVVVETALGGSPMRLASFNKTINLAATGAGGMDTGTAPVSGYVAIYAIYNPSTGVSALLGYNATSAVAPEIYGGANMPAGYSYSSLVAVWPTNASSQLIVGFMQGREVFRSSLIVLNTSTVSGTPASLSIAGAVPQNAKKIKGILSVACTVNSAQSLALYADSGGLVGTAKLDPGVTGLNATFSDAAVVTAQTIWYTTSNTAGTPTYQLYITGYSF